MSSALSSSSSVYDRIINAIPVLARLQDWIIDLGQRKSVMAWLYGLTFLESIIFPLPIDPLFAGVVMARPKQYIRLAIIIGLISTLGGVAGWAIGQMIGDAVRSWGWIGNDGKFAAVAAGITAHGWLFVMIGAFTPLPYKVMAVSAGFLGVGLIPMALASLVGRTARFLLVAAIVRHRSDNKKAAFFSMVLIGLVLAFWGVAH